MKRRKLTEDENNFVISLGYSDNLEEMRKRKERKQKKETREQVEEVLSSVLQTSLTPQNVKSVYESKLNKTLQLSSVKQPQEKKEKQLNNKKRKLSSKEIKEKKLFSIEKDKKNEYNYEKYFTLHSLWLNYIDDLIGTSPSSQYITKIIKADFHGAKMTVIKSKTTSLVGLCGIVIKDSKNAFYFVSQQNQLKIVPKANSNFSMIIKDQLITLFGNHICYRPADRAKIKLKFKPNISF